MNKMLSILLIGALATFLAMNLASAANMTLFPTDDSFVREQYPNTNYNTEEAQWQSDLLVGFEEGDGIATSYLKFDLSSITETITSATLSVYIVAAEDDPTVKLYSVSSNNWVEESITNHNAPSTTSLIETRQFSEGETGRKAFNVLSYLSTGETSFAFKENTNALANFFSKDYAEGETWWRYLYIEFEGQECVDGDLDCGGCISQQEITTYSYNWLNGDPTITQGQATTAAYNWLNGVNSC